MTDLDIQNYYQWSDGSVVTLTNWNGQEPNGGVIGFEPVAIIKDSTFLQAIAKK